MNEEKDPLFARLTKAAGNPRAPKLDESILTRASEGASSSDTKLSLAERFRMASRRLQLGSLAAAGAVGILAVALAVPQQPGLKISLGGSSANRVGASESANKMIAGGPMSSDMKIALPTIEYIPSASLENNPGSGDVYQVVSKMGGSELAEQVTEFFGMRGSVKKDAPQVFEGGEAMMSQSWSLTDGTESVYVYDYGVSSFSYYNSDAYVTGDCLETVKVVEDAKDVGSTPGNSGAMDSSNGSTSTIPVAPDEVCVEFAPVKSDLPSKSTAIAEALRIFNHLGYGITADDLYVETGADYLNITTYPEVNGISVPFWSSVNWGNTGKIASVNGVSIDLVKAGTVKTIGASDSVARTTNWLYQVTAAEPIDARTFQANPYWVTQPGEAVRKIEITSADTTLGLVFDAKGGSWLVPSYKLFGEKGWATTVISVVDGVLDLPSDPGVMPMTK